MREQRIFGGQIEVSKVKEYKFQPIWQSYLVTKDAKCVDLNGRFPTKIKRCRSLDQLVKRCQKWTILAMISFTVGQDGARKMYCFAVDITF